MIKIKLVRSRIRKTPKQRQVLDALGLRRPNMVKEFQDNAAIREWWPRFHIWFRWWNNAP